MGSPLQLPELDRHEATSPEDARLAKFRRRQFYGACFVRSINLHGRLTNLYLMAIFSKEILTNRSIYRAIGNPSSDISRAAAPAK
jgi:hypothetical protein